MTESNNFEIDRALAPPESDLNFDPLLTAKEGAQLLTISEPTFWRHVGNGKLPKPIKLGQLSRWPRSELLDVIEEAKSAREVA